MIIGRKFLNKSLLVLLFAVTAVGPSAVFADDTQPVVILLSDQEEAYSGAVAGFTSGIALPVKVYDLRGDITRAPAMMAGILAMNPRLIFALGAKAAVVSKVWTADKPEIPVVFAMVINWERYDLVGVQENIAGITYDIEPGTLLANLTMVAPASKTLGVIYCYEHSGRIVEKAKKAAEILGLKIVGKNVERPQDFQRAFKSIADGIDSYWILTDPVVYTLGNISWLEERCMKNGIICLGPSANVTKLGVVLGVEPDIKNIGIQAASMARSILEKKQIPGEIGIMPPIGTRLYINTRTAGRLGLQVSQNALDHAAEVVDQ